MIKSDMGLTVSDTFLASEEIKFLSSMWNVEKQKKQQQKRE